jgi:DNA-binding GntR family transcriptional regulator
MSEAQVGPKYRQIYRDLKRQIDAGELAVGDKIPSTAQLCLAYGCSATSVNMAIMLLDSEGYLHGVPGLGRFVKSDE